MQDLALYTRSVVTLHISAWAYNFFEKWDSAQIFRALKIDNFRIELVREQIYEVQVHTSMWKQVNKHISLSSSSSVNKNYFVM